MKTKFTVILLLILTAQFVFGQGLTKDWEKVAGASYSWFSTTDNNTISCAYNAATSHLLVATRGTGIAIINPSDGSELGQLSTTGTTGTLKFNKIRVTSDGVIYAASLITSGTTETIYRWADETAEPTAITYTTTLTRVGDAFGLSGSGTSTVLYLSGSGMTKIDVLTTADGSTFTAGTPITITAGWANGSVDPVTTGTSSDLWVNGASATAKRISSAGVQGFQTTDGSGYSQVLSAFNNVKYFLTGSKKYIATNGTTSSSTGLTTRITDVTSESALKTITDITVTGSGASGAFSANGNASGDVAFRENSSTSFTVYTLVANNAIASYTFNTDKLTSDYYVPIGSHTKGFTSLANAFNWITAYGISGTVNLLIDGNLTEVGGNLILSRSDFSSTDNLVIKPAPTKTPSITISGCVATAGAIQYGALTLNSTSYVTFDGSNNGTTSQDLSIKMNDLTTSGRYLMNLYANTDYITIKNLKLLWAGAPGGTNATCIYLDGVTAGVGDNVSVINCVLGDATYTPYYGARMTGGGGAYPVNVKVQNSVVYGQIRPFYFATVGTGGEISGNTIYGGSNTITGFISYGIFYNGYTGTQNIFNNTIGYVKTNNTSASQAIYGIYTAGALTTGSPTLNIYNNSLSGFYLLNSAVAATTIVAGIAIADANATTAYIYHNSININPVTYGTAVVTGIKTSGPSNITLKNNVISNTYNVSSAYAIYHQASGTFTSDYNDLFATGSNQNVGFYTSARKALADWQGAFTPNQDLNSIASDPLFQSASNLHLTGASPCINTGIDVGIAYDQENNPRVGNPDMGAYEDQALPVPPTPVLGTFTKDYWSFTANWSASQYATGYQLDVATDAAFTNIVTGYNNVSVGSSVLTYDVTGLAQKTDYYFRVRAINGTGNSAYATSGAIRVSDLVELSGDKSVGLYPLDGVEDVDYTDISEACSVLNHAILTGDLTLYLTSDQVVDTSANLCIGVNTNGHKLTIKPYTNRQININFKRLRDNDGPSGCFIIGTRSLSSWNYLVPTHNVVIDGSNSADGTTRDLTITNDMYSTLGYYYGIRVVGNCNNVTIKNVNITASITSTSGSSSFAIQFTPRNDGTNNYVPNEGIVENCNISITGAAAGQGIGVSSSGTLTSGTSSDGMVFRNNIITARTRGIFVNGAKNVSMYGNKIYINQTTGLLLSHGIYFYSTNTASSNHSYMYNNQILQMQTAATTSGQGVSGITIETAGTYDIYNNIITGFNFVNASTLGICAGIRVNTASSSVITNIYHNTIQVANCENLTASDAYSFAGIILGNGTTFAGTADIRNNIIMVGNKTSISNNPTHYGIVRWASTGTITSDYNDVYTPGTYGRFGYWNGTVCTTGTAWYSLSGKDAHSRSANVNFEVAKSPTDPNLHIGSDSYGDTYLAGTPISGYMTDIDGQTRDAVNPYIGADEVPASPIQLITLNVKALVQNFTSSESGTMPADNYTVSLRSAVSPYSNVYTGTSAASTTGELNMPMFGARLSSSYYVVVTHRNSIETWSANPVSFSSLTPSYDFTSAQTQAYGNNLVQVGSKWCLYNGDVNQDGVIDFSDVKLVDNDAYNSATGTTLATDIDGNGVIDYGDTHYLSPNVANYVKVVKPAGAVEITKPVSKDSNTKDTKGME